MVPYSRPICHFQKVITLVLTFLLHFIYVSHHVLDIRIWVLDNLLEAILGLIHYGQKVVNGINMTFAAMHRQSASNSTHLPRLV